MSAPARSFAPCYRVKLRTTCVVCDSPIPTETLDHPDSAGRWVQRLLTDLDHDQEHFLALYLDRRHRLLGFKLHASGTEGVCPVSVRLVFQHALAAGAGEVIVAHSHTTGNLEPSRDDCALTSRLVQAGELIGIPVMDHIIVTPNPPGSRSIRMMRPDLF